MLINEDLVAYLEDLSYLKFEDGEKHRLTEEMEKILSGMQLLSEVDTTDVPERSHPFDDVNAFREDVVTASFDRELILKNAPMRNDEAFIAPKTVE